MHAGLSDRAAANQNVRLLSLRKGLRSQESYQGSIRAPPPSSGPQLPRSLSMSGSHRALRFRQDSARCSKSAKSWLGGHTQSGTQAPEKGHGQAVQTARLPAPESKMPTELQVGTARPASSLALSHLWLRGATSILSSVHSYETGKPGARRHTDLPSGGPCGLHRAAGHFLLEAATAISRSQRSKLREA